MILLFCHGACIGNNVIIGAGSVVSGNIPDNVVIAGNPAKIIRTLDEHYERRKARYINEAKEYARCLVERKIEPTVENMGAFFPLYIPRNIESLRKYKINTKLNGDDEEDIINKFMQSNPQYSSFEEFLSNCEIKK